MNKELSEALKTVVKELRSLSPIDFRIAIEECSKSEFANTIDLISDFTNSVRQNNIKSLNSPIENRPLISETVINNSSNNEKVSKTPYSNITTYREVWHNSLKDD